ncbi:MAG: hypothetical protein C0596_03985 [Marinilabiliales bacterium]|nr:MAG: hypothetical protein C0596_03985 [Marinilabiliales bacterium]
MKTRVVLFSLVAALAIGFASCSYTSKTMKSPNNHVEFEKADFEFSGQLVGEGVQTRVLGIDWAHLFASEDAAIIDANAFGIPIIGSLPLKTSQSFAIYDLMSKNPGYDVVFYPQYETKTTGIPLLFQKSHTKVTARLAKIK